MMRLRMIGLAVLTVGLLGVRSEAQEYYGYTVAQNQLAMLTPGLAASAVGCVPPGCTPSTPPGCVTLPTIGCAITPCPPPTYICPPSGGVTHGICYVYCDQPPTWQPITYTITRNYYVPIYIQNNQPPNVLPVNLNYQWQPIHYLSDKDGNPIDKDGKLLPNPPGLIPKPGTGVPYSAPVAPSSQQGADASKAPAGPVVSTPANDKPPVDLAPAAPATATTTPAPEAPAAPATAQANTPAKRWVWLNYERVYAYGYQRADGYWIIDEGSRRPTLPATTTQPTTAPTVTASSR
ncbi:MAG: hypothetical protein P4L84_37865 [Isosphaeraceae bacterium]|nr:hypothetical protein [Isosphaeraceae bacterium]